MSVAPCSSVGRNSLPAEGIDTLQAGNVADYDERSTPEVSCAYDELQHRDLPAIAQMESALSSIPGSAACRKKNARQKR